MSEQCYNRGCGQKFDPKANTEESCRHHPGAPFFHDAYKGWSCCNKKCTDFTEFLNFKGCTLSKHSNIKPPEPEKPVAKDIPDVEEVKPKHIEVPILVRPPFNSEMNVMVPEIAPSLKSQIDKIEKPFKANELNSDEIAIGTSCKNGGCTASYEGPTSNDALCLHHPGVPIFHEGLKYWSCCQRKTTDFNSFLSQEGCREGAHVWKKDTEEDKVECRWDYHQTGPYVVVSIYAKMYSPQNSVIKLNPIRMYCNLVFPQQNNATFLLDVELAGVIDVAASKVTMYGTKVEIKLKKAEAGSWPKLETRIVKTEEVPKKKVEPEMPKIEAVDLSDL
ncbi:cysteine and histidine-rich domain-containing protein morgana [Anthonomus grandis grandis]|uniref:cysteine and histidine-rich domain-containing protein morgana n=1 Tax=Anthonomus grandis grandis TaxID=2921223 RepID=UPI002165D8EF|nr:cysteine and histidine-rich domain-containing protein morgana [Anthonomus grandis grandis]